MLPHACMHGLCPGGSIPTSRMMWVQGHHWAPGKWPRGFPLALGEFGVQSEELIPSSSRSCLLSPHKTEYCVAPGGTQNPLHQCKGLRFYPDTKSQSGCRCLTHRGLCVPSLPLQTITDPPPKRSCWIMLRAALCYPWLQTFWHLSCVLKVNLLSSVKSTG